MKRCPTLKNRDILTVLILIFISTFFLPVVFAQDSHQWRLPEGTIEWFGKGRIYDVKYTPDGTRLAVATTLGIWIYDATTYQPLHFFKKHENLVERIVFSPDGSILASEERFDKIHLWDVNTGKHKYKLQHQGGIKHFDFSADGQTLVTLSIAGPSINTILYHADTGTEKQVKSMDMNHVDFIESYHTTFDRNNSILATGRLDHAINLWDLAKGVHKKTFRGPGNGLGCLAFSPDGKVLASGGIDWNRLHDEEAVRRGNGTLYVWDAVKGKRKHSFSDDDIFSIRSVAFSPDGNLLASGGEFGGIHLVDPNTGKYMKRLEGHSKEVVAISFSADMRTFVSGSIDGTLYIWDIASGEKKHTFDGFFNPLTSDGSFGVSPDGKTIALWGSGQGVCLWNATAGERRKTPINSSFGGHYSLSGSPYNKDGNVIAAKKTWWFVWDRGEVEPTVFTLQSPSGILSYAFRPDRNTIAIGNVDGTFRMFDMNRRDYQKQFIEAHKGGVVGVAYSPDGKTIVSGSADKTIKLWDANTMTEKRVFSGDMGALTDVALRADWKTIAAVDNTETIHLWDMETSTQKKFRIAQGAGIISVAFSSDGKRLAVGGTDGAVHILDAESGVSQQRFTGHQAQVKIVAFAADGKVLASLSDDGVIFLWDVAATE
ncbi:MAG: WD40 repeat domain-containing protein [Candidatus Poribacteria bacterium]|nr:WD40 repeat domain-containing protein [Candidatus Poribacteria bacterium]